MKTPTNTKSREERVSTAPNESSQGSIRLVSPPEQKAIREWEITLPDELVARLTFKI